MVTWQPYLDPYFASIQLSSMCSIDEDIYLMRCPLICFYAVEYHLPHRVARQFGLRQEFPVEPFSTSIELHKFDRQRQKKVTDFETHHRDYIDEWAQQGDLNYENDQAHTNYNFRRKHIQSKLHEVTEDGTEETSAVAATATATVVRHLFEHSAVVILTANAICYYR
ncbi:serine/threonine-protein phosphatase 7 long form homolog [Zea mays]|uniref:serine/threonine-protein phosphatase 7 long form homolog n=1 Tax=Zea mays TaxID=4577 RepID=UPI001651B80D|nr:serine/threonine-protein phosphatase 7 long form homolog [Zea mays]